jgi:hypothetical protein
MAEGLLRVQLDPEHAEPARPKVAQDPRPLESELQRLSGKEAQIADGGSE